MFELLVPRRSAAYRLKVIRKRTTWNFAQAVVQTIEELQDAASNRISED